MTFKLKEHHRINLEITPHEGSKESLKMAALSLKGLATKSFNNIQTSVNTLIYAAEASPIDTKPTDTTCSLKIFEDSNQSRLVAEFTQSTTRMLSAAKRLNEACFGVKRRPSTTESTPI